MTSIIKATPRANLKGIQDLSRRTLAVEAEEIPQHLPHIYLLTERGPELPQIVIGDSFDRLYGAKSLEYKSKFATHQTVLARTIMANGNSIMVERIKPANAKTALLRFSLEVVRDALPQYIRNDDGTFQYGPDGLPFVDDEAGVVEGFRLFWHRGVDAYADAQKGFGLGQVNFGYRSGSAATATGDTLSSKYNGQNSQVDADSVLYPIMDLEVSSFGSFGDRVGVRIYAPSPNDESPLDTATVNVIKAFLLRIACVERPEDQATPNLIETNGGELAVDMTFKSGVNHPVTDLDLSLSTAFIDSYQDVENNPTAPKLGPFGRIHLYEENIETVLTLLTQGAPTFGGVDVACAGEKAFDATAVNYGRTAALAFANLDNRFLLNFLSGVDQNGAPYFTFNTMHSVDFGGVNFSSSITHYAEGGSDGLVEGPLDTATQLANLKIFDLGVRNALDQWGNLEAKLLDSAKYPVSTVWDSGFSFNTKKKLMVPVSRRKDMWAVISPYAVAEWADPNGDLDDNVGNPFAFQGPLTVSEENALAVALRSHAANYPESNVYGTPVCRAVIIGHSGKLANSTWKGELPFTIDFADKVSRYMGAGDGRWTNQQAFDDSPNNQVTMFKTVNNPWKSDTNYNKDWDAGLNWVQYFDRRSLFYPAFQTVYPDDTSVLNSVITMVACVEAEKVAQRAWRILTGNTSLTKEQFLERSNREIEDMLRDRFDGRFVFAAETFYTKADELRGYSWSCKIHIYANNMKTVGDFTIVAHRMDDLAAA